MMSLLKAPPTIRFHPLRNPSEQNQLVSISVEAKFLLNLSRLSLRCGCFFPAPHQDDAVYGSFEHRIVGDCIVFDDDAFEDPFLSESVSTSSSGNSSHSGNNKTDRKKTMKKRIIEEAVQENLVPEGWEDAVAEINLTKKERRKIAQEIQFNSRVEKKKQAYLPLRSLDLKEYQTYKDAVSAQSKLPELILPPPEECATEKKEVKRVAARDPRWAVYGKGLEDVRRFFEEQIKSPTSEKSQVSRKLFAPDEKALLNKKVADLASASSRKWIPLLGFAGSGDSALVKLSLKQNAAINVADADGMTALHRAIMSKRDAIVRDLLKESANPFLQDKDGATLIHYASQTASASAIKLLLLYNVDINLQDKDGWTALHVAVQARRTDIVKLLLIRGADVSLRNREGLTALDLCLYSGLEIETLEMIKMMKQLPRKRERIRSRKMHNYNKQN